MANYKQFEIGKTYTMHSPCDWDCTWDYKVIARTDASVTLQDKDGNTKRCIINRKSAERFGEEMVTPQGRYSMCPILGAAKCS